jgi:hypothetical protein
VQVREESIIISRQHVPTKKIKEGSYCGPILELRTHALRWRFGGGCSSASSAAAAAALFVSHCLTSLANGPIHLPNLRRRDGRIHLPCHAVMGEKYQTGATCSLSPTALLQTGVFTCLT